MRYRKKYLEKNQIKFNSVNFLNHSENVINFMMEKQYSFKTIANKNIYDVVTTLEANFLTL